MKQIIKRTLSILLALILLVGPLSAQVIPRASAADEIPIDAAYFQDENFRKYVRKFDKDKNNSLSEEERATVTTIHCSALNIASLQGIDFFPALEELTCSENQLTMLDLTECKTLMHLNCDRNLLTALDVSNNTALTSLSCRNNQLTTLDVSRNTSMHWLECAYNQLTVLDVSKNTALGGLYCDSNQLTALDVSNNTALTRLSCSNNQLTTLDVNRNTALEWLYCDNNQLTELDVSKNTALTVLYSEHNQLTVLDVSKNTELTILACSGSQLKVLDLSRNTALEWLYCSNNQLADLDVSKNTALTELFCYNNQLKALDLSKNTALNYFGCSDNQLTVLDVSKNTALLELSCASNQLMELDVSECAELRELSCEKNQIAELDISANFKLTYVLLNGKKRPQITEYNSFYEDSFEPLSLSFDFLTAVRLNDGSIYQTKVSEIFSDVKDSAYYADAVLWAVQNGITGGTGDGKFSPKGICKREQVVTFLYAAANKPEYTQSENPFMDVKEGKYYFNPVMWALENKVTGGVTETIFGVGKPCTREQVVSFLWKAAGSPTPESTESPFTDVVPGKYYYKAVLWANENGITGGVGGGKFGVGKTCTRAQIVTFLYAAYGK